MIGRTGCSITAAIVIAIIPQARGSEALQSKISTCYATRSDSERLKCYDVAVEHELGKYKDRQDVARQEWSGVGLVTTRPFNMSSSWEFQWNSRGGLFQVMMYRKGEMPGNAMPQIVANQTGSGPGSSYVDAGGDYYLVVNATGPWKARAVLVGQ